MLFRSDLGDNVIKLNKATDNLNSINLTSDLNKINNKLFENDAWEAQSQVLSEREYERHNYRDLKEYLLVKYSHDFKSFYDASDIDGFKVVVRDVDYSNMDVREKDGTVTHYLKVYYEDKNGERTKRYVTVTSVLKDDEVEDRKSTRLNSSQTDISRMPSSA